jgi:predicted PurR-regulated permease PerM
MSDESRPLGPIDTRRTATAVAQQGERIPERIAVLLGKRLYGAVALLFLFALLFRYFDSISRMLLIAFVGVIVAMAFNAIVVHMPMRRGIATAIVAVATLGAIVGLVWVGIATLAPQLRGLAADLPGIEATVQGWEQWLQEQTGMQVELLGEPLEMLLTDPLGAGMALITQAFGVLEIVGIGVLVLFGAFFVVAKPDEQLLEPMLRAVPRERRPATRRMMSRMAERLVGWLRGTLISMVIIGALSTLALWLIGAPYPILLGVFIGIIEIIPIVGPWIGGLVAILVTLFYDPGLIPWIAIAILAIQQIEGNLVRPVVMSGAAELHPFVTLLALLLFAAMFGFLGALLALPLTLAIATAVEVFWIEETIGTHEDEIEPMVGREEGRMENEE